jgi:hypothetical protein
MICYDDKRLTLERLNQRTFYLIYLGSRLSASESQEGSGDSGLF